jgi:phage replication O-like protein O
MTGSDRFVRVPTELFQALLRKRLSGGHYRLLLWVIRNTYGWNRSYAPFTWYRIAQDLGMSRPALYRAGQALVADGILVVYEGQLAIQIGSGGSGQLPVPGIDVAYGQRFPLPASNANVAAKQPKRCHEATVFRRAKDSSKDRLKTYKDRQRHRAVAPNRGDGDNTERQRLAGAAKPIPAKYDSLSQN